MYDFLPVQLYSCTAVLAALQAGPSRRGINGVPRAAGSALSSLFCAPPASLIANDARSPGVSFWALGLFIGTPLERDVVR